jgi:hypothetical protein
MAITIRGTSVHTHIHVSPRQPLATGINPSYTRHLKQSVTMFGFQSCAFMAVKGFVTLMAPKRSPKKANLTSLGLSKQDKTDPDHGKQGSGSASVSSGENADTLPAIPHGENKQMLSALQYLKNRETLRQMGSTNCAQLSQAWLVLEQVLQGQKVQLAQCQPKPEQRCGHQDNQGAWLVYCLRNCQYEQDFRHHPQLQTALRMPG